MRLLLAICLLCAGLPLWSQVDSPWTIELSTAEVSAKTLFANGHRNMALDSAQVQDQAFFSLDQVLTDQAGLFIRDYGPAGLSLLNLRGTSAQHTAILWEGVPLNSPMNGTMDLSLIPAFFIDDALVQPGGGSALWGSGAVGGTVQLQSKLGFGQPLQLRAQSMWGSWGQQGYGLAIQAGQDNFATRTGIFWQQAENDFRIYRANGQDYYRQPYASTQQLGVQQSFKWRGKGYQMSLHLWHQQADRQLPPAVNASWNGTEQQDSYQRAVWNTVVPIQKSLQLQTKVAYLREAFTYFDSLQTQPAYSQAKTMLGEVMLTKSSSKRWLWQTGVNGQQVWAVAPGYGGIRQQPQAAWLGNVQYIQDKWQTGFNLRLAIAEGFSIPPVGNLWVRWEPVQNLRLKAQLAHDFRIPTLNDRFWEPVGNPDLQPERSLGQELSAQWGHETSSGKWRWESTGFHRLVDQWILWIPINNLWTPENVQQVRTYGLENTLSWHKQWGNLQIDWLGRYDYVRSESITTSIAGAEGQQLIYTPIHQALTRLQAAWKGWQLSYGHRYTSERFTTHTNSHALPAFHLGFATLSYERAWQQHTWRAQVRVDNCWNTTYDIFMGRRMPNRGIRLNLQLNLNNQNP